ncbi:hypothetical protein [Chitinophaga cymbidii]|uniref:hypothetical protein n=1 Tax=Chitinophaga cymbidii TaxID=1096750 RepID=UPI001FEB461D|nr:hypothetical protein [Chitinophaga cymbidii]
MKSSGRRSCIQAGQLYLYISLACQLNERIYVAFDLSAAANDSPCKAPTQALKPPLKRIKKKLKCCIPGKCSIPDMTKAKTGQIRCITIPQYLHNEAFDIFVPFLQKVCRQFIRHVQKLLQDRIQKPLAQQALLHHQYHRPYGGHRCFPGNRYHHPVRAELR